MAIKSGQVIDRVTLSATTDATVTNSTATESREVYSLVIHEYGGVGGNVDLYLSADATSAAGERIERIVIGANETKLFNVVGVAASQYLVIQSSVGSVNYHGLYTLRNGDDA